MIEEDTLAARSEPETALDSEAFGAMPGRSLIEVLTQLAYRKWLIAKVTGFAILVGIILCLVLPNRYSATTEILPPRQTQSETSLFISQIAGAGTSPLAALAAGGLGLKNPDEIYIGLLQSRPVADAIIRQFGLTAVYHAKDMTGARKKLADNTSIVSEKSGLIAISVTDRDKQRAAAMANAYTQQLRVLTKSLAVTEASQRRLFYEEQLKRTRENLIASEFSFQQVQQKKGLVQPDAQARALIGGLADLHAQLAAKRVELQALRSYSTENNPEVQLAENQLASLQAQVSRLEQRNHSSGPSNIGMEDVPAASLEYLRAQHELQYQQTLFDLLLRQYDAARLDESKEAAIIQVVEPAIPPDRKSSPKRAVILVLSTFVGLFSGCLLARLLHWIEGEQAKPAHVEALRNLKLALTRTRFEQSR